MANHERTAPVTDREPKPPFPRQHQTAPGLESKLRPRPRYEAPHYRPAAKLQDKAALITGGDSRIGRAVALLFAREGAHVALSYLPAEESDAVETRKAIESEKRKWLLLPGDLTSPSYCQELVDRTVARFGADSPIGRPAQLEEVAPAYVFLASNSDSSYITGTVLQVMGGETTGG